SGPGDRRPGSLPALVIDAPARFRPWCSTAPGLGSSVRTLPAASSEWLCIGVLSGPRQHP
ncbi:MAG: hypothetical protein QF391_08305, partial [Myxococcota bacterium]|nr:hypothetical protein [Myxococcota bacterium]